MLSMAAVKIASVSNDTGRFAELLVDEIRAVWMPQQLTDLESADGHCEVKTTNCRRRR
jgi:hypothetical protein